MARSAGCLNPAQLDQLLTGSPSGPEIESFEAHLLTCDSCLNSLKALTQADTLLDEVAGAETASSWATEATERLIQRVRPDSARSRALAGDTPSADEESDDSALQRTDLTRPGFFGPPEAAGDLGQL